MLGEYGDLFGTGKKTPYRVLVRVGAISRGVGSSQILNAQSLYKGWVRNSKFWLPVAFENLWFQVLKIQGYERTFSKKLRVHPLHQR